MLELIIVAFFLFVGLCTLLFVGACLQTLNRLSKPVEVVVVASRLIPPKRFMKHS